VKTTNRVFPLLAALFVLSWTMACQSSTETKSVAVNPPAATATTNSNQPTIAPTATAPTTLDQPAVGSLATPTDAYKTAYAARQKKDIAGLKQVMSQRLLGFLTSMGETEKKTVDDQLRDLVEQPQAASNESRNEKITGDTATLEYLNDKGKWATMDFVKEGHDWKLTLPTAQPSDIQDTSKKPK
jgi:hypothetical protein